MKTTNKNKVQLKGQGIRLKAKNGNHYIIINTKINNVECSMMLWEHIDGITKQVTYRTQEDLNTNIK